MESRKAGETRLRPNWPFGMESCLRRDQQPVRPYAKGRQGKAVNLMRGIADEDGVYSAPFLLRDPYC